MSISSGLSSAVLITTRMPAGLRVVSISRVSNGRGETEIKSKLPVIYKMTCISSNWWRHVVRSLRCHTGRKPMQCISTCFIFLRCSKRHFQTSTFPKINFIRVFCNIFVMWPRNQLASIFRNYSKLGIFPVLFDVEILDENIYIQ